MKKNGVLFAVLLALMSVGNCFAAKVIQVRELDTETGEIRVVSIDEKIDELTQALTRQGINVDAMLDGLHLDGSDEMREARSDEISMLSNHQQMLYHSLQALYHGLHLGKATMFFMVNDVVVPYAPRVGASMKQACIDMQNMVHKFFVTNCNFQAA